MNCTCYGGRQVRFARPNLLQGKLGPSNSRHANLKTSVHASLKEFPYPKDYTEIIQQAGMAAKTALNDSKTLLEIEVPPAGLDTVTGDAEGGIEMNISMQLVKEFCQATFGGIEESRTRVFFPELTEMELGKNGTFQGTSFKLDYLTKPSPWNDIGLGEKINVSGRTRDSDKIFVVAYPHFDPNEMLAVEELHKGLTKENGRPIIVFNGDLDKIRSGYYPAFFYPKLAALGRNFLPLFETVYYIHNFKGRQGGTLFRVYPGPWQVLRRIKSQMVCVHEQLTMPTLKEVALEILSSA